MRDQMDASQGARHVHAVVRIERNSGRTMESEFENPPDFAVNVKQDASLPLAALARCRNVGVKRGEKTFPHPIPAPSFRSRCPTWYGKFRILFACAAIFGYG